MELRFPTTPAASSPTSCLMGPKPGASVNPSGRRWRSACGQPSRAGTSTHGETSITGAGAVDVGQCWDRPLLPKEAWSALLALLVLSWVFITEVWSVESPHVVHEVCA